MRLLKKNLERNGAGSVTLIPDESEDMWHAYNLIQPHDLLTASALRRVTTTTAATGTTASTRVRLRLCVRVRNVDYDATTAALHVAGRIENETPETKVGQFHTLDLELGRSFTLEKEIDAGGGGEGGAAGGGWDSVAIDALEEAVDVSGRRRAEAVAVMMQEGLAHICFIGQAQTILKQKIEMSVPRKRAGSSDHDRGMEKFYKVTLDTLLRQLEPPDGSKEPDLRTRPLLLASPGFVAASFQKHLAAAAASTPALKPLLSATLIAHSSSGYTHALPEVLKSPTVRARLADTRYARESALMDTFFAHLRTDSMRATYGPNAVQRAVDAGAVGPGGGVLMLSGSLFRARDVAERARWVALVDRVRDVEKGEVRVLSAEHESGRRLEGLGGVAALLTYPLPDEDEDEDDDEDEDEEEKGGG